MRGKSQAQPGFLTVPNLNQRGSADPPPRGIKGRVEKARARLGLSQTKFAASAGISAATLNNWEQGRRVPTGAARVPLKIARQRPRIVLKAAA
jgi:DNA-binding transcriptional regulator YiaG